MTHIQPVYKKQEIENPFCECSDPDFELDDNNYGHCVICGKEDYRNEIDYSPSEPEDFLDW